MNIVGKLYKGVQNNELPNVFTLKDVDIWLKKYNILQDNGKKYNNKGSIRSSLYYDYYNLHVNKIKNANGKIIAYYF